METKKLVNITEYARHWKLAKETVYRQIEAGTLTRYEDPEGKPLLEITQRPEVQKYGSKRSRKVYNTD